MRLLVASLIVLGTSTGFADLECSKPVGSFLPIVNLSFSAQNQLYSISVEGFRVTQAATYKVVNEWYTRVGAVKTLSKVSDQSTFQDMPQTVSLKTNDFQFSHSLSTAGRFAPGPVHFNKADCVE